MADLTTAQRLAVYRDELRAAGFGEAEVAEFVRSAAPGLVEDVEVQADLDDVGTPIGSVTVRMEPNVDEAEIRRIVERIQDATQSAAQR